jgi:hypothetical protein
MFILPAGAEDDRAGQPVPGGALSQAAPGSAHCPGGGSSLQGRQVLDQLLFRQLCAVLRTVFRNRNRRNRNFCRSGTGTVI